ncbi:MAG: helix-turn-helix domain-containing protein [Actinomycetia bacterium]|nr:helix-turn-helix domain-containing protein [Actinomycetes bacterium]
MLLTDVRKGLGWSQAKLARTAELCQATVSQIESGRLKPYPNQLQKLANALQWTGNPEELLQNHLKEK